MSYNGNICWSLYFCSHKHCSLLVLQMTFVVFTEPLNQKLRHHTNLGVSNLFAFRIGICQFKSTLFSRFFFACIQMCLPINLILYHFFLIFRTLRFCFRIHKPLICCIISPDRHGYAICKVELLSVKKIKTKCSTKTQKI